MFGGLFLEEFFGSFSRRGPLGCRHFRRAQGSSPRENQALLHVFVGFARGPGLKIRCDSLS